MQHYRALDNFSFGGPLYMHTKAPREQFLNNNHKHGSQPKEFNKNKYTSKKTGPPQAKMYFPCPKVNSVQFNDPYDHINHM